MPPPATAPIPADSESDSDTSSSSGDSDDAEDEDLDGKPVSRSQATARYAAGDSDDENGPAASSGGPLRTVNEIASPDIPVPEIEYVEETETLEFLGEVMSIIDCVVVVKGSSGLNGEKVLDTGSLLAWEDRKVLGLVSPNEEVQNLRVNTFVTLHRYSRLSDLRPSHSTPSAFHLPLPSIETKYLSPRRFTTSPQEAITFSPGF